VYVSCLLKCVFEKDCVYFLLCDVYFSALLYAIMRKVVDEVVRDKKSGLMWYTPRYVPKFTASAENI